MTIRPAPTWRDPCNLAAAEGTKMATDDFELPCWTRDFERALNRTAARIDAVLLRFGEAVSRGLRRLADWIDDSARPHTAA